MIHTNPFKVPLPRIHNMLAQNHYGWLREKYLSKYNTKTRGTQIPSELAIYKYNPAPSKNLTIQTNEKGQ